MSKMFEMLQQAQRDQELLKQSAPLPAVHSRNLDVLHRAGKDQQLFDVPSLPDAAQTEPAPPLSGGFSRAETYKLIQHLFLAPNPLSPRAVVFCGVDKEGGRDWICAQTAELLSTLKQGSICIVDANVTSPSLHSYFGVANVHGLSAALVETGPVMDYTQQVGHGRLRLMNAGEPSLGLNSGPLLASARLAARVRELRANFDYVLVNAPPAIRDSVTGYLGALADGIVLIVEPSFTSRQATREIKEEIEAAGGRVLGVILHRRALSLSDRNTSQSPGPTNGHAH
jgi:Mrp family chromosome partitioning ATPase